MRNLKKILSLVLAMMMVLSLMVTASATTFADDEDIDYKEAVEVMTAAGVINGVGDEFLPKDYLNREAAAKIVAYVMTGAKLDSTLVAAIENPFSDVSGWSVNVIKYCYANGVVDGVGDGKFLPKDYLTGYAFAKMLLVAAGIDGEYTGSNWKLNIATAAKNAGFLSGLEDVALSSKLTREQACQMAFNAMQYTADSAVKGYTVDGIPNTVFSTYLEAYLMAKDINSSNPTSLIKESKDTSSSLLASKFGIVPGARPTDAFGRPVDHSWVNGDGVEVYAEMKTALATVEGATFDHSASAWDKWTFTGATFTYNGGTDDTVDAVDELEVPGMTAEFYGTKNTDGTYTVTKVVATEYYFATIKDVAANGNITLTVKEAGYVISNSAAKDVLVAYDSTKTAAEQSTNYKALSGFAKGTALSVCLKPGWDVSMTILSVVEPEAVAGTVTSSSIKAQGGQNVYSQSYITIDGVKYSFASEYSRDAVDVGSTGTFYLLNGLVVGFVGTAPADAVTDTVYVVDHYAKYVPAVDPVVDEYGTKIKEGTDAYYVIYAQGVDMDGLVVSYPVATAATDTSASATYTANEKAIKLFTAQANGLYTVGSATNVTAITIAANGIVYANGGNNYYYNNAEYVSLLGSKSTLTVSAGTKAGAAAGSNVWAVYGATTSTNKTVSKVFYWAESAAEPAPENVFVYFGTNTVPEKSLITLANGTTTYVYTYNVYEAGEAKTIKSYDGALAADFYAYYVDSYGVCVVSELDGVYAEVENIYGNYITVADLADEYDNFDITGIKVVDLTTADPANANAANGTIEAGEYVVFYAIVNGSSVSIDCIYIYPAP